MFLIFLLLKSISAPCEVKVDVEIYPNAVMFFTDVIFPVILTFPSADISPMFLIFLLLKSISDPCEVKVGVEIVSDASMFFTDAMLPVILTFPPINVFLVVYISVTPIRLPEKLTFPLVEVNRGTER